MIQSPPIDALTALGRLFRLVHRSLPVYLQDARPWPGTAGERGQEILSRMAADHRALAQRLAAAIRDQGGTIDAGRFPSEFPGLHDVSLDFLLGEIQRRLEWDLPAVRQWRYDVSLVPSLLPLADDVLRVFQEHLAMLKDSPKAA